MAEPYSSNPQNQHLFTEMYYMGKYFHTPTIHSQKNTIKGKLFATTKHYQKHKNKNTIQLQETQETRKTKPCLKNQKLIRFLTLKDQGRTKNIKIEIPKTIEQNQLPSESYYLPLHEPHLNIESISITNSGEETQKNRNLQTFNQNYELVSIKQFQEKEKINNKSNSALKTPQNIQAFQEENHNVFSMPLKYKRFSNLLKNKFTRFFEEEEHKNRYPQRKGSQYKYQCLKSEKRQRNRKSIIKTDKSNQSNQSLEKTFIKSINNSPTHFFNSFTPKVTLKKRPSSGVSMKMMKNNSYCIHKSIENCKEFKYYSGIQMRKIEPMKEKRLSTAIHSRTRSESLPNTPSRTYFKCYTKMSETEDVKNLINAWEMEPKRYQKHLSDEDITIQL